MECSSDGNIVVACRMMGFIYLSRNGGTTWITGNSTSSYWWWIDMSNDGTKLAAGGGGSTLGYWTGTVG